MQNIPHKLLGKYFDQNIRLLASDAELLEKFVNTLTQEQKELWDEVVNTIYSEGYYAAW